MKLIIAEKPSLARNIVAGIGKMTKRDGYYENNDYLVSWAFGHLFSLCDIEDYPGMAVVSPDTGKYVWTLERLPFFPGEFRFKLKTDASGAVDAGVKKQFGIISALLNRADVDEIINAGDADREGEIIIRLIISNGLRGQKKLCRLWLPDQTPETVAAALADLKSESDYDNLAAEGFARTYIDWLYGINLSRFLTLRNGSLLRVGRVLCPVVKAIYDRDMAIRNFVPDIYYALVSNEITNGEHIELVSKYKFTKEQKELAQRGCDKLNSRTAVVSSVKSKKTTLNPGKLYSLTKLQNYLGKKYKMSMDRSLAVVQKLYEDGFLTYPRTNSEYLATAEKEKIRGIIGKFAGLGYPVEFKDSKSIFDDTKIESHSALTPTGRIPDSAKLNEDEKKVYSAVVHRFVAVFCSEECLAQKTEIVIDVGECESYTLKGTVIEKAGWTKYDDSAKVSSKVLPKLSKGDNVNINFKPVEKQTSPPKHYTIETLNNYLKNPFRDEKKAAETEDDTEEYRAVFEGLELGTEATRTGIIDNAVKSKYIQLKKDTYTILPEGEFLVQALGCYGISMDKYKTSELGKALKKVYHSEMSTDDAVRLAEEEIRGVFAYGANDADSPEYMGSPREVIGTCPLCGKDVTRTKWSYGCSGYRDGCKFRIPIVLCGRNISAVNAKLLLENGKTGIISGFVSKAGKSFDASLILENGAVKFNF